MNKPTFGVDGIATKTRVPGGRGARRKHHLDEVGASLPKSSSSRSITSQDLKASSLYYTKSDVNKSLGCVRERRGAVRRGLLDILLLSSHWFACA